MRAFLKACLALGILTYFQQADACTAFQLKSMDGDYLYCRSMELGVDLKSKLLIVPQGSDYVGTAPDQQKGLQWKTKYGFLGVNQFLSPTFVSDGINEKGLVVGVLYLPGFAEYEQPDPKKTDKTLGAWELAAYLLGTCASLDEVKSILPQILVAEETIPPYQFTLPLHYYIGDNQGNVITVEYVKGKRYIHENPVRVLTNSPPFDWHLENLSNFVNLSPLNVPHLEDYAKESIQAIGQGSGLLGIPGDYTPPSRFVRAALFSQWATPQKTAEETARLGFHILDTFTIFFGIIREKTTTTHPSLSSTIKNHLAKSSDLQTKDSEYTQWVVVHDQTNLKTYFRTYDGLHIQMVDLKKIDLKQPGFKEIPVQQKFAVEDITTKAELL